MMNFNLLAIAFQSLLGPVQDKDVSGSLKLMLFGMVGIFVVMLLIFLVIVALSKTTGKKNDDEDD